MCLLSDVDLERRLALRTAQRIIVDPLHDDAVQPNSIDLRLGETLDLLLPKRGSVDPNDPDTFSQLSVPFEHALRGWRLKPGFLYLATTLEYIFVPSDLNGQLTGKSTSARLGVVPHQQAGLLDSEWGGRPTLEITVIYETIMRPHMPVAQVSFSTLSTPVARGYGHPSRNSHYQGDVFARRARVLGPAEAVRP